MEAHNGKTRLGSSEVPLVVKFADAKRREQQMQALGMGFKRMPGWVDASKHLADPAADFAYQASSSLAQIRPTEMPKDRGTQMRSPGSGLSLACL